MGKRKHSTAARAARLAAVPVLPTHASLPHNCTLPRTVSLKVVPVEPASFPRPVPAGMDDDADTSHSFPLERFALGSTRGGSAGGAGRSDGGDKTDMTGADLRFLCGFESPVTRESNSRINVNLDKKWVYVYGMPTQTGTTPPGLVPLEAEIAFNDIAPGGIRVVRGRPTPDGQPVTLTITTVRPARFYAKLKGMPLMRRATERDFVFSVGPAESIPGRTVEEMKAKGFIIHEGHAGPLEVVSADRLAFPMSAWLTWRFDLMLDRTGLKRFREEMLALRTACLELGYDVLARTERRVRDLEVESMPFVNVPLLLAKEEDFSVRYLMEGLISNGICVPSEVPRVLAAIKRCSSLEVKERVLASLFSEDPGCDVPALVSERAKSLRKRRTKHEEHQALAYRAILTPTHVRLLAPEPEVSSDALRRSPLPADRFLRVQFTDEKGPIFISDAILQADTAHPAQGTLARIRRALSLGFDIAGRRYTFLAYSPESLADRSCWFVAETAECSADDVRRALGFDGISDRIPAKYASRMGIPFAPSRIIPVEPTLRNQLPDIYTENKASCFTDGAGRCGRKIAQYAAKALGFDDIEPSAIQFQCGGITGVLSVWPQMMGPLDVAFRPSQIMYETSGRLIQFGLNVKRISQYCRGYLNRQSLLLLRHIGVPEHVLEERISRYLTRSRGLAGRFEENMMGENDRRASERPSRFPIYKLASADFNHSQMVLEASRVVEARLLSDLRWDAKLEVDKSVCFMGIADEAGVLEPDEIFCQYEDPDHHLGGTVIVTGKCTIMRESALHPGEIRTVKAVDQPMLRHLKNVIVFPVRGKKGSPPLPELLSGGKLNGDDYILIWDEQLQPYRPSTAVSYKPQAAKIVNGVRMDHVKDFFVKYIVKDVLGEVRMAHLAHADLDGPASVDCLSLASEARVAETFAYTGVPAVLSPHLVPKSWPTFMNMDGLPPSVNSYDSLEILGKLCTMTGTPGVLDAIERNGPSPPARRDSRLEVYTIPPSVQEDAYKCKMDYDDALRGIMKRYAVTEAEVVCGIILRGRPLRPIDHDTENRMYEAYRAVAANARAHADKFLSRRAFKGKLAPRQIYALASYQVTCVDKIAETVESKLGVSHGRSSASVPSSGAVSTALSSTAGSTAVSLAPSVAPSVAPSADSTVASETTCMTSILADAAGKPPIPHLISFPWVFWEELLALPNVHSVDY